MRERLDDLFPEFFRRFDRPMALADEAPGDIRIDVTENDKDYEVRAQPPGVKKDDIRVTVDGNFVSISAEVKRKTEEKSGGRVLVKEPKMVAKATSAASRPVPKRTKPFRIAVPLNQALVAMAP